jgi:hypothetical protein
MVVQGVLVMATTTPFRIQNGFKGYHKKEYILRQVDITI